MFHWSWETAKQPAVRLLLLGIFMVFFYPWSGWWLHKLWWDHHIIPIQVVQAHDRFGDAGWPTMLIAGCGLILLSLIRFAHARRKAGKFLP